ncbi:MAG: peptide chain release factor 2 [Alphaproteobacteria bacterium]
MRAEHQAVVDAIESAIALLRRHFDWDVALLRLEELNALIEDPELWNDSEKAQKIMRERTRLDKQIGDVKSITQQLADNIELIELGEAENDNDIIKEAETELKTIKNIAEKLQLTALLSGEADDCDAYLEVNAGAGGTEACDWASMLLRMYTRWADQHGYKTTLLSKNDGDEAGIKSATIKIEGDQAYGWLKSENGVHRLVRISPFDSNAKRHTSFTSVAVSPVIDDTIEVEIDEKDLKIDTFRSSGAGGQHVNTTDSAVRITHHPTGIVVACQTERSQHQNRANAMDMLRARIYERELQRREDEKMAAHGEKTDIGWGHQIRSYVLQPYQMIKDLRTGVENTNSQAVLDGDIDDFLEASLASKLD